MLCMDDKGPKDVRVFFVDNNRIIEHFRPIIKDNIYTYYIHIENKVDINPENPTVFATDHEEWFIEIDNEGDLGKYLQSFWTKKELRDYIEHKIDSWL